MRLLNLYSINGPNIYSYYPIIVMEVDLEEYHDVYTNELSEFTENLLHLFPGIRSHHCSKGYSGGFCERLERGTLLGHVMEHLALELQSMVGKTVSYGKTRFVNEFNGYRIIYSYFNKALGLHAGKCSYECIKKLVHQMRIDPDEIISELKETNRKFGYGPSTQVIVDEAEKRGIPVIRLNERNSPIQLGYGARYKRIQATITDYTSCIGVDLACNKWEVKEFLGQMGLPVTKGELILTVKEALEAMERLAKPLVVKPVNGNQGKGVTLNINSSSDLIRAYEIARAYNEEVLIEEFVEGKDYRLTVINGQMVAVSHRLPPFVVGDDFYSVRELIGKVNNDELRGEGHEKPLTKIKIDPVLLVSLAKQGLALDSVIAKGKKIFLRENGNLSTGGTAYDVTELVHPDNQKMVERAVRLIGLDVAGVDLRTEDISRPISRYGGAIIEINAAPGIRMHHFPTVGKKRNVAGAIIEMLFPENDGRIPIIAVTGTNGKTTATRLIHYILMQTGSNIGMSTTDGIYLNDHLIYKGDTTGPWSAEMLLKDSATDVVVLETARGGIIRSGLGYDQSDVGIVINVTEDHLGLSGIETLEDLANVKSLVVETVKRDGICVLNGDNIYTQAMAKRCQGQIVYFTQNPQNSLINDHVGLGGIAVVNNLGMIEIWTKDEKIPLISISKIPLTHGGKAIHQVENVLAAIAGLYGLGTELNLIKSGLKSFAGDISTNPGRLNLTQHGGWKVILDYGHNIDGYRAVIDFTKNIGYKRLLGVVGVPGDRLDESIVKIGHLVGEYFDRVWIKEDHDLRGRNQGEVAKLFNDGILLGRKAIEAEIIFQEEEALKLMLKELMPGDVGVIFYEQDPRKLYKIIEDYISTTEERFNNLLLKCR
ncbi:MAG: cyanophycin synthetase [Halanaerobiales bacterium]|nr:cyanophycin synthetase [Halanaerobiales bacterium]